MHYLYYLKLKYLKLIYKCALGIKFHPGKEIKSNNNYSDIHIVHAVKNVEGVNGPFGPSPAVTLVVICLDQNKVDIIQCNNY